MDILATFSTDEQLEQDGVWSKLSPTASIRVAREGNPAYVEMLRERLKEAQLGDLLDKEADALAKEIVLEVTARTILVGWKGIKNGDVDVPYSPEKALEYLRRKDFLRRVESTSKSMEFYRLKAEVEQGKG